MGQNDFLKQLKRKSCSQIITEILSKLGVKENIICFVRQQKEIQESVLNILNSIFEVEKMPKIPLPGENWPRTSVVVAESEIINGNPNEIADAVEQLIKYPVLGIERVKEQMKSEITKQGFERKSYNGISIDNNGNINLQSVYCAKLSHINNLAGRFFREEKKYYEYNTQTGKIECRHIVRVVFDIGQDESVLNENNSHFTEYQIIRESSYTADGKIKLSSKRSESTKTFEGKEKGNDSNFVDTWIRDSQFPIIALTENENSGGNKKKFELAIGTDFKENGLIGKGFKTREEAIEYCTMHKAEIIDALRRSSDGAVIIKFLKDAKMEGWQMENDFIIVE